MSFSDEDAEAIFREVADLRNRNTALERRVLELERALAVLTQPHPAPRDPDWLAKHASPWDNPVLIMNRDDK